MTLSETDFKQNDQTHIEVTLDIHAVSTLTEMLDILFVI